VAPATAGFLRFAVAALMLMALTAWTHKGVPRIRRGQILPLFLLGLTGVFSYNIFFFKGLTLVHAGRAAMIIALNPITITLFSALIFKERLSPIQCAGVLLSVAGAVVVVSHGHPSMLFTQGVGLGEVLILGCVASWSAFSLIGKAVLSDLSPLVSITFAATIGGALLAVPAFMEGFPAQVPAYAVRDWLSIVYLGAFGTVFGFIWYYQGIRAIGPSRAGLFINVVPVSGILLARLILDEPVTLSLAVGGLLVLVGIYVTNRFRITREPAAAPPACTLPAGSRPA